MFAARAFAAGDQILRETSICWGVPDSSVSTTLDEAALSTVLLQMAPTCWAGPPAAQPPLPAGGLPALIAATMKANAWGCRAPGGGAVGAMRAVFPVLCLTQHSCASVAAAAQVGGRGAAPTYALTARAPIAEGQEITVSYVPRSWEKQKRRLALNEGWGFSCACSRCAAPVDDTRAARCTACVTGRCFLPDNSGADDGSGKGMPEAVCAECGAPAPAGAVEALAATGELPPPPPLGAPPAQLRAAVVALLRHPALAPDDSRVLFALNSLVPAASGAMEGGGDEAESLFKDLLRAIIAVAQRSNFVNLFDLGITIE